MSKYNCLQKNVYLQDSYSIFPIRHDDIQVIRLWRNDQLTILRQKKLLSEQEQEDYFKNVTKKTFNAKNPNCILFSFLLGDECIGYGGLVHIDWNSKTAEISFLNETKRSNKPKIYEQDFAIFLKLIFQVAFLDLNFNKLTTETYEFRNLTIKILENYGFRLEGRLKNHVLKEGKYFDSILHGLLKEDYKKLF